MVFDEEEEGADEEVGDGENDEGEERGYYR